MFQGAKPNVVLILGFSLFTFILFSSAGSVLGQDNVVGSLQGFIYEQDGLTPLEGAILKFRNVTTSRIYESEKSDNQGFFRIEKIERGMYVYGVTSPKGSYNSEGLLGLKLKANEIAEMSIALKPYSKEAVMTLEEFYRDLEINGESYVGKVIDYDGRMTQVLVERGFIQMNDKVHTKGLKTDFTTKVDSLTREGIKKKRVYAGQTASLRMKQDVEIDDMVFIVKKKRFLPFFGGAVGALGLLAANGLITWGIVSLDEDCVPCSPYEPKKK